MNYPKITFVIPTRNRQECLLSLLKAFEWFHCQRNRNFEIVVLDNSDDDCLKYQITNYSFPIKYEYSAERLSVVDNFNKGVPYIEGDYACFIGDDDLICRSIFNIVELMDEENIDAAITSHKAKGIYFWPGVKDKRWGNVGGNLYLSEYSGDVKSVNVKKA